MSNYPIIGKGPGSHPITSKHGRNDTFSLGNPFTSIVIAAISQFIPGGGLMGDFLKGVAGGALSARLHYGQNAYFEADEGPLSLGVGVFVGSQVLSTNILTNPFIPTSNDKLQDIINAIVAGAALYESVWQIGNSKFPALKNFGNFMEILYLGEKGATPQDPLLKQPDPQLAQSLQVLYSFAVAFFAMRQNVAQGMTNSADLTNFLNGFIPAFATAGTMVGPTQFQSGAPPTSYDLKAYIGQMLLSGTILGVSSWFLSQKLEPIYAQFIVGILNSAVMMTYIVPRLLGYWGPGPASLLSSHGVSWSQNPANPQNQN